MTTCAAGPWGEAHRLHLEQGWSGAQIAANKGVKESTSDNYVADAMRAGRAYRFWVLGVPGETLHAVSVAVETLRSQAAEAAAAAAAAATAAAAAAAAAVVVAAEAAAGAGAVSREEGILPEGGGVAAAAELVGAGTGVAAAAAAAAAVAETAGTSTYRATLRSIRELLATEVPYTHVSYALAHLERLQLLGATDSLK